MSVPPLSTISALADAAASIVTVQPLLISMLFAVLVGATVAVCHLFKTVLYDCQIPDDPAVLQLPAMFAFVRKSEEGPVAPSVNAFPVNAFVV